MEVQKYFKVTCKCGHTGSKKTYIPITFPVKAINGKEAASKARWIPRCKHHHKDCVQKVVECTYEEYIELIEINKTNPYLSCKCIQDQRRLNIESQFVEETQYIDIRGTNEFEKLSDNKAYYYGKKRIKHPKKYMSNIYTSQSRIMEIY